jgi:nucleoid-associated protein YgaU
MFFKGSRYKEIPDFRIAHKNGETIQTKSVRLIPDTPGIFKHTVKESDRLDLLAFKYYGDPKKWWLICDANPEFSCPLDIQKELGAKIIIPPNRIA